MYKYKIIIKRNDKEIRVYLKNKDLSNLEKIENCVKVTLEHMKYDVSNFKMSKKDEVFFGILKFEGEDIFVIFREIDGLLMNEECDLDG